MPLFIGGILLSAFKITRFLDAALRLGFFLVLRRREPAAARLGIFEEVRLRTVERLLRFLPLPNIRAPKF
jgi:hypothetical protein